jgi:uncharacterized protein DUF3309
VGVVAPPTPHTCDFSENQLLESFSKPIEQVEQALAAFQGGIPVLIILIILLLVFGFGGWRLGPGLGYYGGGGISLIILIIIILLVLRIL